jgi:hypothetical protein
VQTGPTPTGPDRTNAVRDPIGSVRVPHGDVSRPDPTGRAGRAVRVPVGRAGRAGTRRAGRGRADGAERFNEHIN